MQLHHPNLVALLHVITQTTPMALVLEYMTSGSLSDWLHRNATPKEVDLLFILHQVACGMACLEGHGIGKE